MADGSSAVARGGRDVVQYPIEARAAMVDEDMVRAYLARLFGSTFWKPHSFINARGVGEKGTPKEGVFQEDCWAQPGVAPKGFDGDELMVEDFTRWCRVWAKHDVAAYIVPAVLKEARGAADAVESFPALVVDLDGGDTLAKSAFLKEHLGPPTMAVASGGTTAEGKPKLHLYWVLEEPCAEVGRVVDLRHEIAVKAGGDLALGRGVDANPYGRAHQPIRVPGSVHCKNGVATPVRLLADREDCTYDIDVLAESIRRMPRSPWALPEGAGGSSSGVGVALGFGAFSPDASWNTSGVGDALTQEVHEGGEDRTRWSEFSRVAGFYLAEVRRGNVTLPEALGHVKGWTLAKMVPPWPEARVEREWRALLAKDEGEKGAMPAAAVASAGKVVENTGRGLREWTARDRMKGETPRRKFLVDGLVLAGKPHLLVAEGGAGKTFAMLDLCTKIAAREDGEAMTWMGREVLCETGTVVMFTTEDDLDELHIRMDTAVDPGGKLRDKAGEQLIIVPAVNTPRGPFAFVERDRMTGAAVPSPAFRELVGWLGELPNLRLVVVDTLNTTMHGEENSATVVNEYARTLAPICGELGAALMVTHHIRKQDSKFPIVDADDMFNAVRGSSALPAAFRAVLGLWHSVQWGKVLPAMGMEPRPKRLWNLAVLKANNPEMVEGTRVLLRGEDGLMVDVTDQAQGALGGEDAELKAWVVRAVQTAADAGDPYLDAQKSAQGGLYGRRSELHPKVRQVGRTKLLALVDGLVAEGVLVGIEVDRRNERGQYRRVTVLDVEGGRYDVDDPERVDPPSRWRAPDWANGWAFDPATGEVSPVGSGRMVVGRGEGHADG